MTNDHGQLTKDHGQREHPDLEEMQVIFLLPPLTSRAGGVKTLSKNEYLCQSGMLPGQLTTDKQQTTNNKQQKTISARIATEKTKG